MDSDRVYILDEADRDYIIFCISYNFEFKFFPSADRLLYKDLMDHGSSKTSLYYSLEFVNVIYKTTACSAHRISRSDDNRIAKIICDLYSFLNRVCLMRSRHLDTERSHSLLELDPVFTSLNGIYLDTYYLNTIFIKYSCLGKFRAEIKT